MRASDEFRIALNEYLDTMVNNTLDIENSYSFLRNPKIKAEVKTLLKPNINKLAENEVVALYAEFKNQDVDMKHRWDFFKKYVKRGYIQDQINYYDICDAEEEKIETNAVTLLNGKYSDRLSSDQINVIVRDNKELAEELYVGDLTLKEFLVIATHDYSAKLSASKNAIYDGPLDYHQFATGLTTELLNIIASELQSPNAKLLSEVPVANYVKSFGPTLFKVFSNKAKSKGDYKSNYTVGNFVFDFYDSKEAIVNYFSHEIKRNAKTFAPKISNLLVEKLNESLKSPAFKYDINASLKTIKPNVDLATMDVLIKTNPSDYGFGESYFEEKLNSGYSDFYFPGLIHFINAKITQQNVEKEYEQAVGLAVDDVFGQIR